MRILLQDLPGVLLDLLGRQAPAVDRNLPQFPHPLAAAGCLIATSPGR